MAKDILKQLVLSKVKRSKIPCCKHYWIFRWTNLKYYQSKQKVPLGTSLHGVWLNVPLEMDLDMV